MSDAPTVSDKAAFLDAATKLVTVDGLTCRIKKLKAGELLDIVEADGGERAQALRMFAAGVVEPEFSEDEFMQLDAGVYLGVAEAIQEFSGLEEAAARAARKSVNTERGQQHDVPVLDGQ